MATYRVTSSALNMRAGPATSYPAVATLPQHKILDQFDVSDDGTWYRARTTMRDQSLEGWVSARHVVPEPISIELPATAPWLVLAERELGVSEIRGAGQDNPRIVEYLTTTPRVEAAEAVPWCSAFVNWCVSRSGLRGTNDALARSWLRWGIPLPNDAPRQGCIAVLSRGSNPTKGHVGFYVATKGAGGLALLGGNQGDRVTVASYPDYRLLGYRWAG